MAPIEIKFDDQHVRQALNQLASRAGDLRPALRDIGEYLIETTKRRFATGTAPDGTPWKPNTQTTLLVFLGRKQGWKGKGGRLNKRGGGIVMGKRPLIGESKRLSKEINARVSAGRVEVGSSLEYSAVQQYGAKKKEFGRAPWGDIPARPFLGASDQDRVRLRDIVTEHLTAAWRSR